MEEVIRAPQQSRGGSTRPVLREPVVDSRSSVGRFDKTKPKLRRRHIGPVHHKLMMRNIDSCNHMGESLRQQGILSNTRAMIGNIPTVVF